VELAYQRKILDHTIKDLGMDEVWKPFGHFDYHPV